MIIDCHAHLMPQSWFHPKSPKSIFDLGGLFKEEDESGVDMTVFGNNWIRSPDGADALRLRALTGLVGGRSPQDRPRATRWTCGLLFAALGAPRRPHVGGNHRPEARASASG